MSKAHPIYIKDDIEDDIEMDMDMQDSYKNNNITDKYYSNKDSLQNKHIKRENQNNSLNNNKRYSSVKKEFGTGLNNSQAHNFVKVNILPHSLNNNQAHYLREYQNPRLNNNQGRNFVKVNILSHSLNNNKRYIVKEESNRLNNNSQAHYLREYQNPRLNNNQGGNFVKVNILPPSLNTNKKYNTIQREYQNSRLNNNEILKFNKQEYQKKYNKGYNSLKTENNDIEREYSLKKRRPIICSTKHRAANDRVRMYKAFITNLNANFYSSQGAFVDLFDWSLNLDEIIELSNSNLKRSFQRICKKQSNQVILKIKLNDIRIKDTFKNYAACFNNTAFDTLQKIHHSQNLLKSSKQHAKSLDFIMQAYKE